ncbi:MAG: cytochrome c3 family protein [Planctomycetota bacterium]
MTVLFPKWTNKIPTMLAFGAAVVGLTVVLVVTFWFSPKHTDVGYQPHQPIAYSHKLHAGSLGMDRYCHRNVEHGATASVPDNATCMGCHSQVKKDSDKLAPMRAAWGDGTGDGTPVEWVKVHLLPDAR